MNHKTRIELKAALRSTDVDKLESWILSETNLYSLYPDRVNNSIYFETSRYSSAMDNIDGLSKRTKVRFRWYGDSNDPIKVGQLEFKRKRNNEGWKEQYKIECSDHKMTNYKEISKVISSHLPVHRQVEFADYNLPYIFNSYNRSYYSTSDRKITVTIDRSIEAYDQRWSNSRNKHTKIFLPNLIIVEFKFDPSDKPESLKLLKNFPFRVSKHSKYINAALHSR